MRDRIPQLCMDGQLVESRSEDKCLVMADGTIIRAERWIECQPGPDGCSLDRSKSAT